MSQVSDVDIREQTLNQVLIFSLDCNIWSARKKLNREDLPGGADLELPEGNVISLGSKRICDPEKIAVFEKLKRRAVRACEQVGSRFLGGYAVPRPKARDLAIELKAIEAEFQQIRQEFLDGYAAAIDDWVAANPRLEAALRKAVTPKCVVERRLGFAFSVTKVASVDDDDGLLNQGLLNELGSLSGQLFYEVARDARDLLEKSIVPRQGSITQRAVSSLRKLQQKLEGFMFLDGRIGRVANHFGDVLSRMPKAGHVEGRDFTELFGLVVILSDEAKLKQFAAGYAAATESGVAIVDDTSEPATVEAAEQAWFALPLEQAADEAVCEPEEIGATPDFSDFDDLAEVCTEEDAGPAPEADADDTLDVRHSEVSDVADAEEVVGGNHLLPLAAKSEGAAPVIDSEMVYF